MTRHPTTRQPTSSPAEDLRTNCAPPTVPPNPAEPGGRARKPGAPRGNKNARKHGLYAAPAGPLETVDDAIAHLGQALARLDDYMVKHAADLTTDEIARLASVYGMNLSRFVRMLRDRAAAAGDDATQLEAAIDAALALASEKLGTDLLSL